MEGIILSRRETPKESILLKVIFEDGELQTIRLPGILKSKKRTHLFYMPGAIWNFDFTSGRKIIPKESNLIQSPVGIHANYDELTRLAELLKPLRILYFGDNHLSIYKLLYPILRNWNFLEAHKQNDYINYFYIHLLDRLGYLPLKECVELSGSSKNNFFFQFREGFIQLKEPFLVKEDFLPCDWISFFSDFDPLSEKIDNTLKNTKKDNTLKDTTYRENICNFLFHL